MTASYRLRVLGESGVWTTDAPDGPPVLGAGKPLALLVYLALAPGRSAARARLADLLWSGADPEKARNALRQAIFTIRRRFGQDAVVSARDGDTLALSLEIDRDAFVAAVQAGDHAGAVARYTGPFLEGFGGHGTDVFEDWADLERRRLRDLFVRTLEALVRQSMDARRPMEAVPLARRLRDAMPEREESWRLLLEALLDGGNPIEAAAEADGLRAMLAEAEREPARATRALLRRAERSIAGSPTDAPSALQPSLIGRERELLALQRAWETARAGAFVHAHITGIAGIGKSRLLGELRDRIRADEGAAAPLRAHPSVRHLPFGLAAEVARALASLPGAMAVAPSAASVLVELDPALRDVFPAAPPASPPEEDRLRQRALAVGDLLAAVADEQPLALLIDDLHWGDGPSLHLLAALASRAPRARTLLVTTSRNALAAEGGWAPGHVLSLAPLDVAQVTVLLEGLGSIDPALRAAGFVEALQHAAGGNPLFVLESLRMLLDADTLRRDGGRWQAPAPTELVATLLAGRAIARRLAGLSPAARAVLGVLSLAGVPVPSPMVEDAARRLGVDARVTVELLERDGMVRASPDGWEPEHDLLSEEFVSTLDGDEARRTHAALGATFAAVAPADARWWRPAVQQLELAGDRDAVAALFQEFERARRRDADWRAPAALAAELLGMRDGPMARHAIASLPWTRRWNLRAPLRRAAVLGATGLLGAAGAFAALRPVAVRLEITQAPPDLSSAPQRPLVVRAVDAQGRAVAAWDDSVSIQLDVPSESLAIAPAFRSRRAVDGAATFDTLHHEGDVSIRHRFRLIASAPGLRPDTVARIGGHIPEVHVDGMVPMRGARVRGDTIVTSPGAAVEVLTTFRTSVPYSPAAWIVVAVPFWGDRTSNHWTILGVPTGKWDRRETLPLLFDAPTVRGTYRLLFALGAETQSDQVASATGWAVGRAIWNDGDDLRDLPDSVLGRLGAESYYRGTKRDIDGRFLRRSKEFRRRQSAELRAPMHIALALLHVAVR